MVVESEYSKYLYAIIVILGFPLVTGFSLSVLDAIHVVAIREIQLDREHDYNAFHATITIQNSSRKVVKINDCKFDAAISVTRANSIITLGEVRLKQILIEHQAGAASTDTDIPIFINPGPNLESLRKAGMRMLESDPAELKQQLNVSLQGDFELCIQAKGGWVCEERIEIDWTITPEIERTVLETFVEAVSNLPAPQPLPTLVPTIVATPTVTPAPIPTTAEPAVRSTPMPTQPIEVFSGVKLLKESFVSLQQEDIPSHLLERLETLIDRLYVTPEDFRNALQKALGKEHANHYRSKIQKHLTEVAVIYFRFDKSKIENIEAYPNQLDTLQQWVKKYHFSEEGKIFHIEGHADSRGTDQYNMELSRQRSESVWQYLTDSDNGFKLQWKRGENLVVQWFGKRRPLSEGTDEQSHQLNRRVELYLVKQGSME